MSLMPLDRGTTSLDRPSIYGPFPTTFTTSSQTWAFPTTCSARRFLPTGHALYYPWHGRQRRREPSALLQAQDRPSTNVSLAEPIQALLRAGPDRLAHERRHGAPRGGEQNDERGQRGDGLLVIGGGRRPRRAGLSPA